MSSDLLNPGAQNANWANLYCNTITANSYNIDGLTLSPPATNFTTPYNDETRVLLPSKNCKITITNVDQIIAGEAVAMVFSHPSITSTSFILISPGGNGEGEIQSRHINLVVEDILDPEGSTLGAFGVSFGNVGAGNFNAGESISFQLMIL